jgi:hypothetical protein
VEIRRVPQYRERCPDSPTRTVFFTETERIPKYPSTIRGGEEAMGPCPASTVYYRERIISCDAETFSVIFILFDELSFTSPKWKAGGFDRITQTRVVQTRSQSSVEGSGEGLKKQW